MQKLPKNAKAILGAVTLALFSFAGARAGVLVLPQQHLDNASVRSSGARGHAALTRLPATAFRVALAKNRHAANNFAADSGITLSLHRLSFAGTAIRNVASTTGKSHRCSTSPRAPPIS